MDDIFFMKRALRLAKRGGGKVSPNPMVGALIVKNERIISEGYHAFFGGPHAEVDALRKLKAGEAIGSTLYVNLEPCSHYGKTPPCTDAIIKAGIKRVVIGMVDPNPLVHGRGIDKLKKAGIEVRTGILEEQSIELNEPYIKYITKHRPFVTLKIAQTLDGRIATSRGFSRWITGEKSRRFVHKMRRESDAVLVGVNTVIADDPQLTVRMVSGKGKRRVILDSSLRIPLEAKVLHHSDPKNTVVVTTDQSPPDKVKILQKMGVTVWILKKTDGMVDLVSLWQKMADEGIASVLVEGGRQIFTTMLRHGEVDRVIIFFAPKIFGEGINSIGDLGIDFPDEAILFKKTRWYKKENDMIFEGRL